MSSTAIDGPASEAGEDEYTDHGVNYINASQGWKSWAFTLDHKRIGLMYLIAISLFFAVGGLLALAIRLEMWTPTGDLFDGDTYNQIFTLHGAIMVFVFIIPSVPASLGNFLLPLMLGAKDVAFPKLNLTSWYLYVFGAIFLVAAMLTTGLDTGWTFYTPYSSGPSNMGMGILLALTGVFILGFSSILTGVNFITTIHKMRAPGQGWYDMPLFLWGIYATSVIQVLATPVLAITLFLLILERTAGIGIFGGPGGDPVLFQHFFWFYSHPAVYIMILPGFGIMSELVTTHAQKQIFGYKAIALSSVAIALIGFLVWGHHMFVSGQSEIASVIFSFLTFAVAVPTAIKVFSWVATLYKGSIALTVPMLYALGFLFTFTIGGLTGLVLGTLATDVHLHDTYYVVSHFHYVMVGGMVIAFLGGLHHWWPKISGKVYNHKLGVIAFWLIFIGFNVTFFIQLALGSSGMPRRYHSYDQFSEAVVAKFQWMHQVSTVGSLILFVGLALTTVYLLHSWYKGAKARQNPWGSLTFEWTQCSSPPIEHNFHHQVVCESGPYDYPVGPPAAKQEGGEA